MDTATTTTSLRCTVNSQSGTIVYRTRGFSAGGKAKVGRDEWVGVRLDGETRVDEYPADQVKAVAS